MNQRLESLPITAHVRCQRFSSDLTHFYKQYKSIEPYLQRESNPADGRKLAKY